jgi:hypothetical protein
MDIISSNNNSSSNRINKTSMPHPGGDTCASSSVKDTAGM